MKNKVPDPVYKIALPHHVFPGAEKAYTAADMNDKVKKGFYLVTIGHCMECHSAWSRGVSDFKSGLGRVGRAFPLREVLPDATQESIAPNITSHPTAGIGGWTDAEIVRAVTQGIGRDGRTLKPPMAYGYYAALKAADLADIVAYLRTVPP